MDVNSAGFKILYQLCKCLMKQEMCIWHAHLLDLKDAQNAFWWVNANTTFVCLQEDTTAASDQSASCEELLAASTTAREAAEKVSIDAAVALVTSEQLSQVKARCIKKTSGWTVGHACIMQHKRPESLSHLLPFLSCILYTSTRNQKINHEGDHHLNASLCFNWLNLTISLPHGQQIRNSWRRLKINYTAGWKAAVEFDINDGHSSAFQCPESLELVH